MLNVMCKFLKLMVSRMVRIEPDMDQRLALVASKYSEPLVFQESGKRFGSPSSLNEEQQLLVLERFNAGARISAVVREFGSLRQAMTRLRDKAGR